jgi:hypothetical protein
MTTVLRVDKAGGSGLFAVTLRPEEATADKDVAVPARTGVLALLDDAVPRRQTVLLGPVDSSGLPSFGNTTPGTSTITTSGTIVMTAACGRRNRLAEAIDATFTGVSTNGTMYLYADLNEDGTYTTGAGTLAPVYQHGGTYSTTNGQFTFNIQEWTGKVGNGVTATTVYRVYLGEATVSGGVVTAVTWYALSGRYYAVDTNPPGSTRVSKNHNLGLVPTIWFVRVRFAAANGGYAIGDEVPVESLGNSGGTVDCVASVDRQTIGVMGNSSSLYIANKTTGTYGALSASDMDLVFFADRGW